MRWKIFRYIVRNIFRIPENEILPKYLISLRWILLPLETYCLKSKWINFDPMRGIFTIFGIHYSEDLFRSFSKDGLPINTHFEIVQRENGTITIRRWDGGN